MEFSIAIPGLIRKQFKEMQIVTGNQGDGLWIVDDDDAERFSLGYERSGSKRYRSQASDEAAGGALMAARVLDEGRCSVRI